jgi:hypothetical protein
MPKNSVYLVEDVATAYYGNVNGCDYEGGYKDPRSFIEHCKDYIDQLYADDELVKELSPDFITEQTLGISFYKGIVVFEKGSIPHVVSTITGM